jgi:hypothetical protein
VHESTAHATHRRRPRAVSFVASLLLFEAVLVVLAGILVAAAQVAAIPVPMVMPDDAFGPFVSVVPGLGLAIIIVMAGGGLALAGLGLLRLREWGWVLAMALQGLGLANALYTHIHGVPQYLPLALCSFVVLVLNQREVRQALQVQSEHA